LWLLSGVGDSARKWEDRGRGLAAAAAALFSGSGDEDDSSINWGDEEGRFICSLGKKDAPHGFVSKTSLSAGGTGIDSCCSKDELKVTNPDDGMTTLLVSLVPVLTSQSMRFNFSSSLLFLIAELSAAKMTSLATELTQSGRESSTCSISAGILESSAEGSLQSSAVVECTGIKGGAGARYSVLPSILSRFGGSDGGAGSRIVSGIPVLI
jgi:hypothetical protein